MRSLVTGLKSNNTLTRLLLDGEFPSETNVLAEYLQTSRSQPSSLRELAYNGKAHLLAGAMVLEPHEDSDSRPFSVGSDLRTLRLGNQEGKDMAQFFSSYAANAPMIHLESLTIECLHKVSCKALSDCIPNLVHLKELKVSRIYSEAREVAAQLIESIKKNGSLHSVEVPSEYSERPGSYRKSARVNGRRSLTWYCQRNRSIPMLLEGNEERTGSGKGDATGRWLFPSLFFAARRANRTAPNMILIGLRTLSGSVGPVQSSKRVPS
jgi:hypothetical protein